MPATSDQKETKTYSPTYEVKERLKELEQWLSEAKEARKSRESQWRRNEQLISGDFLAPYQLPKYKSRIVANVVHSVVSTNYSIMTDRFPKVDFMPQSEESIEAAAELQETAESEMAAGKFFRAVNGAKYDLVSMGNGGMFVLFSNDTKRAKYVTLNMFSCFPDPLATDVESLHYFIYATPVYLDDLRADFPEAGRYVKPEGQLDAFRAFIRRPNSLSGRRGTQMTTMTDNDGGTPTYPSGAEAPITTDHIIEAVGGEGGDEPTYGGGMAIRKDCYHYVWEDEVYFSEPGEGEEPEQLTRKVRKLKLASWANSVLLQDVDAPNSIPLCWGKNYASAHSIWGVGEPEVIESLAVGIAILLSQSVDNVVFHGNPTWEVPSSWKAKQMPSDRPGQVLFRDGPHEQARRIPAGELSASVFNLIDLLLKEVDQVSMIHDITSGRNPTGVTAARAISQLQEASQQVIRTKEREIGSDMVVDAYRLTVELLKDNYEGTITVRKQTDTGWEFKEVHPGELSKAEVDFKYVPGSSLPESRAARRDEAVEFFANGILKDHIQMWKWMEKDCSREFLQEELEAKRLAQEELEQDLQTIQDGTDEDEIMDALIRVREALGYGSEEQPEQQAEAAA